jgi:hypothetical protein
MSANPRFSPLLGFLQTLASDIFLQMANANDIYQTYRATAKRGIYSATVEYHYYHHKQIVTTLEMSEWLKTDVCTIGLRNRTLSSRGAECFSTLLYQLLRGKDIDAYFELR